MYRRLNHYIVEIDEAVLGSFEAFSGSSHKLSIIESNYPLLKSDKNEKYRRSKAEKPKGHP